MIVSDFLSRSNVSNINKLPREDEKDYEKKNASAFTNTIQNKSNGDEKKKICENKIEEIVLSTHNALNHRKMIKEALEKKNVMVTNNKLKAI